MAWEWDPRGIATEPRMADVDTDGLTAGQAVEGMTNGSMPRFAIGTAAQAVVPFA